MKKLVRIKDQIYHLIRQINKNELEFGNDFLKEKYLCDEIVHDNQGNVYVANIVKEAEFTEEITKNIDEVINAE